MILREAIQRIQSLYSRGVESDDTRLSSRHIYSKLTSVRSRLISQQAKKKQKISQWNYQTLPCVELIPASKHECACLPEIGCKVLKSKYKLPKPLSDLSNHLIQSVTSLDGSIIFNETTFALIKYKSGARYTQHKPDYWIRDGYLYLTSNTGIKAITVTMLSEDPAEAALFPSYCATEDCPECIDCESPLDKDFPIDNDLVDALIELSAQELIIMFSQGKEDTKNDTREETNEGGR